MRALVTGGSGFVGRALIRALVARGDTVIALARSDAAAATVAALGASVARGDLEDVEALATALEACDAVFHCAALVDEWGAKADFERINVTGTRNLLSLARVHRVKRFVHVSTEAVYADGGPMTDIDERRPLPDRPLPRYAATKNCAERCVAAANRPDFTTVIVRPRLIWGVDDSSVLPKLVAAVRSGRFLWVDGGRYLTSTCHVRNVVEGLLLAADKGRGGEAYFVTDGEPVEFRRFFEALLATQGVQPADKSVPRRLAWRFAAVLEWLWDHLPLPGAPPVSRLPVALGGQSVTVLDGKARGELGYVGHVSREQGLAEMRST